ALYLHAAPVAPGRVDHPCAGRKGLAPRPARLEYVRIARLTGQVHQGCMAGLASRPAPTSAQIRRFVIAVGVTIGERRGCLVSWVPGLCLAAAARPGGACLWAAGCVPGGSGARCGADVSAPPGPDLRWRG